MKETRKTLIITCILFMAAIWGFIVVVKGTNNLQGTELYTFILIIVVGIVAIVRAFKRDKEERLGLPAEDEFSNLVKYKSGYYSYLASMYMWFFIFIFKDKFPDVETMLGGGILLSTLIAFITKFVVKQRINEK